MEDSLRNTLPGGLTVKLLKQSYLDDPSKQLVTSFRVYGQLANASSKRMFVPLSIFEMSGKPKFTEAKREMPIYFHYGYQTLDEISITYPSSMEVESTPPMEEVKMEKLAILREGSGVKNNTITLARNFGLGAMIFKVDEYESLRTFYAKVAHKDQEQAVLKVAGHAAGN
jgi:hypothetical protein